MLNNDYAKKQPMPYTTKQIAERLLYLLAVVVTPSTPLFFLYQQNASQDLLFKHFLIFGGVLALISLVLYLLISKFALRRRRTMILMAIFWSAFWFFGFFQKVITRGNADFSQMMVVAYLLVFICVIGFILRFIKMNRALANVIAIWLCLLFTFNFVPGLLTVFSSERQRVNNEKSGELPYEIKSEFYIDPDLPHPNVYWLHMDGMMGFEAVERYFNEPQTELKNKLAQRGFLVNESARLEAGYTVAAIPAMTSPTFYDSYLADEFDRTDKLTRNPRQTSLHVDMTEKGFSFNDIHPHSEIFKAFSDAGFTIIGSENIVNQSEHMDMWIDGYNETMDETINVTTDVATTREANIVLDKLFNLKDLVVDASALSAFKPKIDELIEKKRLVENSQPIPEYQETVSKYISGNSDSNDSMAGVVRAMKYVTSAQAPHFAYYVNMTAHCLTINTIAGDVAYEEPVGRTFMLDEDGNYYKERLEDPLDVRLYYPQHKYAAKQMMAQVDIIIENDPDAVIIIQGDHGINAFGPVENGPFHSELLSERGYSVEDQLNLNLQVISAVRMPPQYGELTQPLDPLDISRYLVNHFVGGGNYDYLYYIEEDSLR